MNYKLIACGFLLLLLAACSGSPATSSTPITAEPARVQESSVDASSASPQAAETLEATNTPIHVAVPATATPSQPEPATAEPQATAEPPPAATPVAEQGEASKPLAPVAVVVRSANLRAGPGTDFPIVGEIKPGQKVFLKAQNHGGDWMQLDMEGPGQTWIAAFLLDLPVGLELPPAADAPPPPASPTPGDLVTIRETRITLPTYPWKGFTTPVTDPDNNWTFQQFDRTAYLSSNPQPAPVTYRLVTLENKWLKLTLMPDLGGRLYQMIFKPTGNNELYQNPVIKPSPWGPTQQGNGWLAAGGIEWGLPVAEHGYAWGEKWGYITDPEPTASVITVFDKGQDRLHLYVDVGLRPDSAAFTLDFTLENMGDSTVDASYWTNAMVAPGAANSVGPDLRFLIPGDKAQVHSSGEPDLPADGGVFDWPVYNGRDVSRLGTWNRWLGFFAYPQAQADWAAVYDTSADEGVVRIFPNRQVPGIKGFGFGWSDPIDPANYTDDGSTYAELQGGITPTFSESVTFEPGASRRWQEVWYPVAGISGITAADSNGAVHLSSDPQGLRLRIFSTSSWSGELIVSTDQGEVLRMPLAINPAQPVDLIMPTDQTPINLSISDGSRSWRMNNLSPNN